MTDALFLVCPLKRDSQSPQESLLVLVLVSSPVALIKHSEKNNLRELS